MMGPYYYYDTSYVEDVPAEVHIHDCMWSGECYACQPTRLAFSGASVAPSTGTVPITVGGSGYITLTSPGRESPLQNHLAWPERHQVKFAERSPQSEAVSPESSSSDRSPSVSPKPDSSPERTRKNTDEKAHTIKSGSGCSSSDNKKLRHREVEKNRHRQLQAMVKTLSEKIPGRLDKETQVQTMKRAARYCVYLREVVSTLTSHGQPAMLKEKLEKIYLRSCDSVELIMSQHMSAR